MYLILIGWLYVVLMFAVAQDSLVRSGFVLFFLGVLPTWLTVWLVHRRRRLNEALAREAEEERHARRGEEGS
ncbi:hypothetical protein [Crenobacter cavernae]|uniref:Uncharacterized protein n=1 Tax=Crenobacter cavernae TaxID=2290923 RepID=A0ABY0FCA6_9NEIS|nr:hypothetical protein [Crenobacter cavernae]RXZ42090.1 hypothetical protein EBB06_13660 [Crenobacter cavernae]